MDDSWCVVGLTPSETADGRPHLDGAACAITADGVVAVAEERVSRRSHQGGSELALRAVLGAIGRRPDHVDRWILSTCGESATGSPAHRSLGSATGVTLADLGVQAERVAWIDSHHLSHALTASIHGAPGDVVLVADDAGTDLGHGSGIERATAYVLDGLGDPVVVDRVAGEPMGLGAAYRLATEKLGLDGYTECGKAMALAAYASLEQVLPSEASHPMLGPAGLLGAIDALLAIEQPPRWEHRGRAWHEGHVEAAGLAQAVIERGLAGWLDQVLARLDDPPARVILAGGVALNCKAVGLLSDRRPDLDVVVVPAPGDTGQALGNALHGVRQLGLGPPTGVNSALTGPEPRYGGTDDLAAAMGQTLLRTRAAAIRTLAAGAPLGVFDGRSELGPRALGQRSILVDPRRGDMREVLNEVKGRERFRPFGLVAFDDVATRLVGRPVRSPFMLVAHTLVDPGAVPAAVHIDGSCRIQTVPRSSSSEISNLLQMWERETGLGALINTSFNAAGQPMVEHPPDAIEAAEALGISIWMPGHRPDRASDAGVSRSTTAKRVAI